MISNSIELLYDPYEYLTEYGLKMPQLSHLLFICTLSYIVLSMYYVNEFQTYYISIAGRIEEGETNGKLKSC